MARTCLRFHISIFKFIGAVQEKVPNDSHISDFGLEWNGQDMFEISNLTFQIHSCGARKISRLLRLLPYATPRMVTNSRTEATDFSSAAFSSAVSLISIICSTPRAPSFTGTPTYNPLIPYSPSR